MLRRKYDRIITEYCNTTHNTKNKLLYEFLYFVQNKRSDLSELANLKHEFMNTMYMKSKTRNTQQVYSRELNRFVTFIEQIGELSVFQMEHESSIVEPMITKPIVYYAEEKEDDVEEDQEYLEFLQRYEKLGE